MIVNKRLGKWLKPFPSIKHLYPTVETVGYGVESWNCSIVELEGGDCRVLRAVADPDMRGNEALSGGVAGVAGEVVSGNIG